MKKVYNDIRLHFDERLKFVILCGYTLFRDELKQRGN